MLKNIRPLDCIFFKGTSFYSKAIIELDKITLGQSTTREWSHLGLVINKEMIPNLNVKDNDLYIWESTLSSTSTLLSPDIVLDVESNEGVFGVQIRKLKDVIDNNLKIGVGIGWGKLINNPCYKLPNENENNYKNRLSLLKIKLNILHTKNYHRPYQTNIFRLLGSIFTKCSCCRSSCCFGKKMVFCSQFVANVYESLGILPKKYNTRLIVPQDISNPEKSSDHLPKILDIIIPILTL